MPTRILLTAFEPYDQWDQNSSWEALCEYLKRFGSAPGLTTRRYPVDLQKLESRLTADLERGFDAVLHMGQAPGIHQIHLEAIAINVAGMTHSVGDDFGPLVEGGPMAFRSRFPLGPWVSKLRSEGIMASVSYHAGTYLCNAAMYLSHHWHWERGLNVPVGFLHLPLTQEQVLSSGRSLPSLGTSETATAIGVLLNQLRQSEVA
jgi:pyroglutamyl-peptidase